MNQITTLSAILIGQANPRRTWKLDEVLEQDLQEAEISLSNLENPLPPLSIYRRDSAAALVGFQPGQFVLWHGMMFYQPVAGWGMWQALGLIHPELPDMPPHGPWFAVLPTPLFDSLLPSEQTAALSVAQAFAFALLKDPAPALK